MVVEYLGLVDELSEGDISLVSKDVTRFEVAVGAIPELKPKEVAGVRRRATTKLNGEGRGIVCCECFKKKRHAEQSQVY